MAFIAMAKAVGSLFPKNTVAYKVSQGGTNLSSKDVSNAIGDVKSSLNSLFGKKNSAVDSLTSNDDINRAMQVDNAVQNAAITKRSIPSSKDVYVGFEMQDPNKAFFGVDTNGKGTVSLPPVKSNDVSGGNAISTFGPNGKPNNKDGNTLLIVGIVIVAAKILKLI